MKNISLTAPLTLLALGISCQVSAVQVLYPSASDFHSPAVVPHESAQVVTYDSPHSPVYRPTIPPNAAPGLELNSDFVVPTPSPITQAKMRTPLATTIVTTPSYRPSVIRGGLVAPRAFRHHRMVATPSVTTTVTTPTERSTVITTETYTGNATAIKPHELEPYPRGRFTRFITTIPVTSYSDELPVTVTITVSS